MPSRSVSRASDRAAGAIREFLRLQSAGGVLLMLATAAALLFANTRAQGLYQAFLETPVEIRVGALRLAKPLLLWINDGLMAVFFFLLGLEIKREVSSPRQSSLRRLAISSSPPRSPGRRGLRSDRGPEPRLLACVAPEAGI